MTLTALIPFFLALALTVPDGAREGRRGNRLLGAGDTTGAVAAYREGLQRADSTDAPDALSVRAALWNNLGLALSGPQPDSAAAAFEQALALAPEPEARARYAYNAGTVAARAGRFDAALPLLRRALVLTPGNEAARFDYEFVKRRLQQEQQGNEGGTPPEPSAFARALKARADSLVAARRYADALALLQDGLARDSTVAAFGDYLQRLQTVVEIEQLAEPAPDSL